LIEINRGPPAGPRITGVRRAGYGFGALLLLVGIFWSGRESVHCFGAFWEHWWCPLPVVAIIAGLATGLLLARNSAGTT
jgi:hypothetical protein